MKFFNKDIQDGLSADVKDIMMLDNSSNKKRKIYNAIALSLLGVGVAGCITTSVVMNDIANKYKEIMDDTYDVMDTIATTDDYIQAKEQYENLMYGQYRNGNITLEEFSTALENYSKDKTNALRFATPEQEAHIQSNIAKASEYDDARQNCLMASIPLYSATGVGGLTYAMFKIARLRKKEEYDFSEEDIDLPHY